MKEKFIKVENVEFIYKGTSVEIPGIKAVDGISAELEKGQFIVILGQNGSGKSTFARLINALLTPTSGVVYVKGMDTKDSEHLWDIRSSAGMVFQNPDNQIVGTIVEEDVAFGPENLGVEPSEIRRRVDNAIETVGISEYKKHAPYLLSGGQKQRVAIAGILAMKPECIILDEATAMLDPIGRKEVMRIIRKLNKEESITVIHITHHMDEAALADRLLVVDEGRVLLDGKPSEVFSQVEKVKELGLDVPQVTELLYELNKEGYDIPWDVLDVDGAFEVLRRKLTIDS